MINYHDLSVPRLGRLSALKCHPRRLAQSHTVLGIFSPTKLLATISAGRPINWTFPNFCFSLAIIIVISLLVVILLLLHRCSMAQPLCHDPVYAI